MNAQEIANFLSERGHQARLSGDRTRLIVSIEAGGQSLTLEHTFPERIERLPPFSLRNPPPLGTLAHVIPENDGAHGKICVEDRDSVSINYDVPNAVYAESLTRHERLITRLIEDPEWNQAELLREFHANWAFLCDASGSVVPAIYFLGNENQRALQVKLPSGKKGVGLTGNYLALSNDQMVDKDLDTLRNAVNWRHRTTVGKAITLNVDKPEPAPGAAEGVLGWYLHALEHLDDNGREDLTRFRKHPGKEFWLLFSVAVSNGRTWIALQFRNKRKLKLPISAVESQGWELTPRVVRPLTKETLVPRGGASLDLQDRSVLLVGCGSVGSEVAHRLASSGVGKLTISDGDRFSEENLYRHTLEIRDIGYSKCSAVAQDIRLRCPWIRVEHQTRRLEDLHDKEFLEKFDVVIVAIGSPTLERLFNDFIQQAAVSTPIVNVWVEAHGVGGHATLEILDQPGCLKCAYVDPDTLNRGLASNLNFLAPNQDVTQTHAGCGDLFLPYSSIAAGYTATMATDLAVKHLLGLITSSSKISWRGDGADAERSGLILSHRYHEFSEPMKVTTLFNEHCDVCS